MGKATDNDKWISEVMDSLSGMQRIPASDGMYENVMRRMGAAKQSSTRSQVIFRRIAAAAIILFVINIASILHVSHKSNTVENPKSIYQVVNEEISYLSEDNY